MPQLQEQLLAAARSLGFQHYVHAPDVDMLGGWAPVFGDWALQSPLRWFPNLTQWIDGGVMILSRHPVSNSVAPPPPPPLSPLPALTDTLLLFMSGLPQVRPVLWR